MRRSSSVRSQGETTAIASGLAPGDLVVVDGADKLREGAKVELITRDAQAAPAARRAADAAADRPPGGGRQGGGRRTARATRTRRRLTRRDDRASALP